MNAGQLRQIGTSSVSVTQYGLGGTALGNIYTAVEDQAALDTIHAAYGAGVRYFDTAPLYGSGLSEIRLGKGLARYHRDEVVISSKVGWALEPRPPGQEATIDLFDKALPYRGVVDYSADAIKRSLEDSLTRLNTELEQQALTSFLPLCAQKHISLIIGGPYNSGILASGAVEGAYYNYQAAPPGILDRVRKIEEVCAQYQVSLQAAALQFPFGHSAVASIIPGARSVQELADNVGYFEQPIPADFWAELQHAELIDPAAPVPGAE
jgi:aryl-alcohol dehydrogenase-like predicted oxidoreductase